MEPMCMFPGCNKDAEFYAGQTVYLDTSSDKTFIRVCKEHLPKPIIGRMNLNKLTKEEYLDFVMPDGKFL